MKKSHAHPGRKGGVLLEQGLEKYTGHGSQGNQAQTEANQTGKRPNHPMYTQINIRAQEIDQNWGIWKTSKTVKNLHCTVKISSLRTEKRNHSGHRRKFLSHKGKRPGLPRGDFWAQA